MSTDPRLAVEAALVDPGGAVVARRVVVVSDSATFSALAAAIHASLGLGPVASEAHEFELPDGGVIAGAPAEWGEPPIDRSDLVHVVDRVDRAGDRFEYLHDGTHRVRCRVVRREPTG